MGRGQANIQANAGSLLFGPGMRQGTRVVKLTKKEQTARRLQEEIKNYESAGGVVEQDEDGIVFFMKGKLHREGGPAFIYSNGKQEWYLNGQRHREDGPAVSSPDGTQKWFLNGQLHRSDGPALIFPDGTQQWWLKYQLHRTDGPAVTHPDGTQQWWLNGKRQR